MWKSLPLIMSAMSRSRTGSAKALKRRFLMWQGGAPTNLKPPSGLARRDIIDL